MTTPDWFLLLGAISVIATSCALLRIKHLWWFMPWYFAVAWLTGELAVFHIAWQVVVALLFVLAGALDSGNGVLGLALCLLSWLGLYYFHRRGDTCHSVHERALQQALGADYRDRATAVGRPALPGLAASADWWRPFAMARPGVERVANIAYGDAGRRHRLDIYRPREAGENRPVLLQIHGGAWMIGSKEHQALPLMYHLASRGWLCVAVNYRLSPRVKLPQHLIDVKRALAWVREHIREYGGNPDFVVATGGSAGGHLCSLLALTANAPALQPSFESVDTSVAACVPFYGVYDLLDRDGVRGPSSMTNFLERHVMPAAPADDPVLWELMSPITHARPQTPPFFVIAGTPR